MTTYQVPRMGEPDLEFEGELLAERDTKEKAVNPDDHYPADPTRWMVIQIYRVNGDKGWVTSVIGKSTRKGERDRPRTWVCPTPEAVRESLRRRTRDVPQGYLTRTALDALADAAAKDERLKSVTVEQL